MPRERARSLAEQIPIGAGAAVLLCRERVCNNYMTTPEIEQLGRTIFTRERFCEAKTHPGRIKPAWHIGIEKYWEQGEETRVIKEYRFWILSGSEVIPELRR